MKKLEKKVHRQQNEMMKRFCSEQQRSARASMEQ